MRKESDSIGELELVEYRKSEVRQLALLCELNYESKMIDFIE
jgi:hypothetical protein